MLFIGVAVLVVVAVAAIGTFRVTGALPGDKPPIPNPDTGLTDPQRLQKVATMRADFETRYATWVQDLDTADLDFGSLPHSSLFADYAAPEANNLQSAANVAQFIAVGTVSELIPSTSGSSSVITVETTLKGETAGSVRVLQSGGLRPAPDWTGIFIADADNAPTLVPGDRVVLLLHPGPSAGSYYPESYTGIYRLAKGAVVPVAGNPFSATASVLTEPAFVDALRAAISAP
jgi:hypothetical protein